MAERDYQIIPRTEVEGGGWQVRLYEDGVAVDGGAFQDHDEALAEATVWISEVDDDE
jgi:hypothetical protein